MKSVHKDGDGWLVITSGKDAEIAGLKAENYALRAERDRLREALERISGEPYLGESEMAAVARAALRSTIEV